MEKDATDAQPAKLITELPRDIFPEARQQELGGVALASKEASDDNRPIPIENGRFGNGVELVETPGPTAYNQARANGTLPDHIILGPQ